MIGRPTLTIVVGFVGMFILQAFAGAVGIGTELFALALPLAYRPWTLVTNVFAHSGLLHLLVNSVALLVVGPIVAWRTTTARFYLFFVLTGTLAGVAQVVLAIPFGGASVLGGSGAIFALLGYLLVGNRFSERTLSWLPVGKRGRVILFILLAGILTAATAAPGVALASHFVGFCLGVGAGRVRLLRPESGGRSS